MNRRRPGAASLALLLILVITAAWWGLALWPAGAVEPAWLIRTRAACFGSAPGGLPDAGGWILLIGEPIGMFAVLMAVWGGALREDLRWMRADRRWRIVMAAVGALSLVGLLATGQRVAHAAGLGVSAPVAPRGTVVQVDIDGSAFTLTDQQGRRTSLADFPGRPVLLTFAFGHCATVCPRVLHDVRIARAAAGRPEVPILVITLDPWRDTPSRLPSIARLWELDGDARVLSGPPDDVERVLNAWRIPRTRNQKTGDITHPSLVYVIGADGRIAYVVSGDPQAISAAVRAL
jgi:protein SCO1/2